MKQRKLSWDRLSGPLELSGEPMPGIPLLELAGERRVLIENHGGVTEYSREKICINVRYGQICILGYGLELARMSKDQLIICGRIDGIALHRGRC